jgi:hypothetical protein
MDNCGNVQMDKFWNFVAVPTFLGTMFFGIYVLFTTDEAHFATKAQITSSVQAIKQATTTPTPSPSATPTKAK